MYDLLTYAKICSRSVEKSGVDALKDTLKTMFPVDGIRIEENGTDPVYVPGFPYHMYVVLPGCRFINWGPWRKSDLGVIQVVFNYGENECPISHFEVPVGFSEENKAVLEKTCSPERAFWLAYQAVNYSRQSGK